MPIDWKRRSIAVSLSMSALFAACSEGEPEGPFEAGAIPWRLALRPSGEPRVQAALQSVARIEIPDELPRGWHVKAAKYEVVPDPDAEESTAAWVLQFEGDGPKSVMVPADLEAGAFNQIAVEAYLPVMTDVIVELRHQKELIFRSETRRVMKSDSAQVVLFDVPRGRVTGDVVTTLRLLLRPKAPRRGVQARLAKIDVIRRPPLSLLPEPEAPAMVEIAGRAWPAAGLSSRRSLTTVFEPEDGDRFAFAYGVPNIVLDPAAEASLRVSLDVGGEARVSETFDLEQIGDGKGRWMAQELPLDELVGERVTAHFSLIADGEEEAVCALSEPLLLNDRGEAPTVVLVTSDTHRADHLGAADGETGVRTPFLDSLAARGTLFLDSYAATNVTTPSHVSLMTAFSPRDTGVINNTSAVAGEAWTLAEAFREAGYVTLAAVSATHLAPGRSGLGQGFDRFSLPIRRGERVVTETIDDVEEWLEDTSGMPVFLWLHVFDAHTPYLAPKELADSYYGEDPEKAFDENLPPLDELSHASWSPNVRDVDYIRAQYKAEVTFLDEHLGRFLSKGRLADALIAVTADHGESLGDHDVYWSHTGLYPGTVAVPLIFAGPGVPVQRRVEAPVSTSNIGRTLLDLVDLQDVEFPGEDLLATHEGDEARYLFSSHGLQAAICQGRWYLVLNLKSIRLAPSLEPRPMHAVELYDREADPSCGTNLLEERPDVAARLRSNLVDWLLAARPEGLNTVSTSMSEDEIAALAALGYAAGSRAVTTNDWFDADCDCSWCERFE